MRMAFWVATSMMAEVGTPPVTMKASMCLSLNASALSEKDRYWPLTSSFFIP